MASFASCSALAPEEAGVNDYELDVNQGASVLTLSSNRLCARIQGVGQSLEQRVAALHADLRQLADPRRKRVQQRKSAEVALCDARAAVFAAARCLRAWQEVARPSRMKRQMKDAAFEQLAAGIRSLEWNCMSKESELLGLATRLSRALFQELQDARYSLAYAHEQLAQLQRLEAQRAVRVQSDG
mmetsp:Transcript_14018/g.31935  ORF Transcript_14018/g.31935 Transcript_14018/m.31935 type:complete len:185 (+) Transcript_14018:53-607(+)